MFYESVAIYIFQKAPVDEIYNGFPPFLQVENISCSKHVFTYCPWKKKCRIRRAKSSSVKKSFAAYYHRELSFQRHLRVLLGLVPEKIFDCCNSKIVITCRKITSQ